MVAIAPHEVEGSGGFASTDRHCQESRDTPGVELPPTGLGIQVSAPLLSLDQQPHGQGKLAGG